MENTKRIAQLFMLHTLGELSHTEETELNSWRLESPLNEEVFQFETNHKNIADMYREIEEKKDPFLQKFKDANPQIWGQKLYHFLPRIHIPRWLEAAMFWGVITFSGYSIIQHWDVGSMVPGGYKSNMVSANWMVQFAHDVGRGFNEGKTDVNIEKDPFGNEIRHLKNDKKAPKNKNNILYTPRGGFYNVRLPDGTLVMLNAESSIWYPANYDRDTVRILLKGEAYFEVNRDSLHPFIVDVQRTRLGENNSDTIHSEHQIMVTRGHFNVKAYPNESFTATIVQGTGIFDFDNRDSYRDHLLIAGEQVNELEGGVMMIVDGDSTQAIGWKNGRFLYKEAGIVEIMLAISRWYDVPLTFHDSISVRQFHLDLPRNAEIHEAFKRLSHQGIFCDIEDRRIHVRNSVQD